MVITIDGLGVNGKSTLAKRIAKELNFKNFNTGAIYRCIALEIVNHGYDITDIKNTVEKLSSIQIDFVEDKTFLNGEDYGIRIKWWIKKK